jgi:hypothetical protein
MCVGPETRYRHRIAIIKAQKYQNGLENDFTALRNTLIGGKMNIRLLPGLFLTCVLIMPSMAQKQESHGIVGLGNEKERMPAKGCRLVQKALNAIGNPVTLGAIRSRRWKGSVRTFSDSASYSYQLEKVTVYPDKTYEAIRAADGSVSHMVVTPNFSYVGVGDGRSDLPRATVEGMQNGIKTDPIYIAQHWSNYSCAPEGTELIGRVSAVNVRITGENGKIQWSIDPSTGHILRTRTYTASGGEIVTDYSDFHLVAGTSVSFKMHTAENGRTADITITEYESNPTLDPKLFELPSPSSQAAQLGTLSDTFVRAGLAALRSITRDITEPEFRNGELLVNRATQTAIDEADTEARTAVEQAVVVELNHFYLLRLNNNLKRSTLQTKYSISLMREYSGAMLELRACNKTCFRDGF